ncbi:MAG: FapA family protein [Spirochaetaceae bacterium]|jgi:uncharacterized protein (DUF342 family)|nr:FapA family protein [Spirochaetaceae bacterium]
MGRKEENRTVLLSDNPYSGNVVLRFSENDLEVWADFIPPTGVGAPLTMELVLEFLVKQNIVYGLLERAIAEALEALNSQGKPVLNALIAKGDPPIPEIKEHFELNSQIIPRSHPLDGKRQIDYRASSPFIIVKKDQTLAYKRARVVGREGKNVRGAAIPYKTVIPDGVSGGVNTKTSEKYIAAGLNGQFIKEGSILHVSERLEIKGSVGYETGHIEFPGDVIIKGFVCEGFKIYAEGSITIKQTLDVTEVVAGGDLNVSGGIIGHGRGIARIRGKVTTKFIENCRIACRKTIQVERAIINSTIYTMETVDMGSKGIIISGDVTAIHGIKAAKIGKTTGKGARLHCGIDFIIQQELEKANNHSQLLSAKVKKIRYLLSRTDQEKHSKLEDLLKALQKEQNKLTEKITDLLKRVNADEHATIEVSEEIAPGTLIEICQVALFVAKPLRRVRIRLDKFFNKLIPEPL